MFSFMSHRSFGKTTSYLEIFFQTISSVCLGFTSLLNILGHMATVLACAATQEYHAEDTGHDTQTVTVYRHRADLLLCYPLMWNVKLECTTTHFNVLGEIRSGIPHQPSTHTSERLYLCCWYGGSQ